MMPEPLAPPARERPTDAELAAVVERLYRQKKGVAAALINVGCHEGIVELKGFTTSLLSQERAADMAKAVRGVRGVINEISVRAPDVPDAELLGRVARALLRSPAAGGYPIRCCARQGEVAVEGTLRSVAEERLALHVLLAVPGVRRLSNHLHVGGGGPGNSDGEITTQIRELLGWDLRVRSALVRIHTARGTTRLTGTVGSAAEHDQVVATAYAAGATHVEARGLLVARWALDPALRRPNGTPKTDAAVAQAIRDALRCDLRVGLFALTIHVREGVATLLGGVSSLRAQLAAGQDAGNVVGVLRVYNRLQVQAQNPSPDAAIAEQILIALANDAYLGGHAFAAQVTAGAAQLHGTVGTHFERERAADVAAGCAGVAALASHVQVCAKRFALLPGAGAPGLAPPPRPDDADDLHLEQRIRHHYDWSGRLQGQGIAIHVCRGRATLTGTVGTPRDRQRAATGAYGCGACEVDNHLHLVG